MDDSFIEAISVLQAIRAKVSPTTTVHYAQGCDVLDDSRAGFAAAVEAARNADVVVLVMGDKSGITPECTSGEARDRAELDLPGVQGELVRAVYETGTPVVLVLVNGRPVTLKWMAEQIPAIVETWLPGEEGANAIADVLFGDINPGGKLPITFPRSVGQVPIYYGHKPSGGRSQWLVNYVETSVEPQYPFGFGLSYTSFDITNLKLDRAQAKPGESVAISVDVTNTGSLSGDEVVQLYVRLNGASVTRPIRELKGFRRITLQPAETRTLTFALPVNMLAYYDRDMNWVIEPVRVDVLVGNSSADLPLTDQFSVTERAVVAGRVFSCPVDVQ
jgi:beta-glucosidase